MSALEQLEQKNKRGIATELELCILMAGSLNDARQAAHQLITLQTNCDNAIKANIEVAKLNVDLQEEIAKLNTPMPCGHLARYVTNSEEGTQYCVMCVLDATQLTIINLVNEDE